MISTIRNMACVSTRNAFNFCKTVRSLCLPYTELRFNRSLSASAACYLREGTKTGGLYKKNGRPW